MSGDNGIYFELGNTVKLLIIGGILGVLVLALGWGVYFWRKKKKGGYDHYSDSDDEPVFIKKKEEDQFMIPFTYSLRNQQLATCKLADTELNVEDYKPPGENGSFSDSESERSISVTDQKKRSTAVTTRSSVIVGSLTRSDESQKQQQQQQPGAGGQLKRYKSSMALKQKNIAQDMMSKLETGNTKGSKKTTLGVEPEARKISVYDSYSVDVGRKTLARRRGSNLNETLSFKKSGMIHFALEFHPDENQLEVYIARCSDLPSKKEKPNFNLFVRICLSPGKKQRQDTNIVSKSKDPIFGETLYFQNMDKEELLKQKLKMKVYNQDKLRRNALFGRVDILLSSVNLDARELFDIYLFKQRSTISLSSVSITLCHQATFSKLDVTIGSLRKVPTRSKNSSIYGAVTLFKEESQSKNTSIKAQTKDPVFKETFTFEVITNSSTPLNTFSLVFSLIERNIIGQDEIMGHVIFSMTSPQSSAIKQWNAVQNEPHVRTTSWHFLVDPDEL